MRSIEGVALGLALGLLAGAAVRESGGLGVEGNCPLWESSSAELGNGRGPLQTVEVRHNFSYSSTAMNRSSFYITRAFDLKALFKLGAEDSTTFYATKLAAMVSSPYTHHLTVFLCPVTSNQRKMYFERTISGADGIASYCSRLLYIWGRGIPAFCTPSNMAFHIDTDFALVVEVHVELPSTMSRFLETSGFALTGYFANPKSSLPPPLHMSMLFFLNKAGQVNLSPGKEFIELWSECDLLDFAPPDSDDAEQTVYAVSPHGHSHAKLIRGELESPTHAIRPISCDDSFDTVHHALRPLDNTVKFSFSDKLIVHCTYDTRGEESVISSGYSGKDEMCGLVLWVYGPQPLGSPYSSYCLPSGKVFYNENITAKPSCSKPEGQNHHLILLAAAGLALMSIGWYMVWTTRKEAGYISLRYV